jgi:hypothetical protein
MDERIAIKVRDPQGPSVPNTAISMKVGGKASDYIVEAKAKGQPSSGRRLASARGP